MSSDRSTSGYEIRSATQADLADIFALERSVASAPHWAVEVYWSIVDAPTASSPDVDPRRCLLVATALNGQVLGFAAGVVQKTGPAELESLAVAPSARRRGIGAALCCEIAAWARTLRASELLLEVRMSSDAAVALYKGLGFEEIGRRPGYYREPEDDAILMRLALA